MTTKQASHAIRATRSAPAMSLAAAAAAAGISEPRLSSNLGALQRRGRCDRLASSAATDTEAVERVAAARSRHLPPPGRRLLSGDRSQLVRDAATGTTAWNGRTFFHQRRARGSLTVCATATEMDPRSSVAEDPTSPAVMLWAAIGDTDSTVREAVAANPAASLGMLAALIADPSRVVRTNVAQNTRCGHMILAALACDTDDMVRDAVAENQRSGPEILAALAAEPGGAIRRRVAQNPNCDPETLAVLAADQSNQCLQIRHYVAQHPNCDVELLKTLATGPASTPEPQHKRDLQRPPIAPWTGWGQLPWQVSDLH